MCLQRNDLIFFEDHLASCRKYLVCNTMIFFFLRSVLWKGSITKPELGHFWQWNSSHETILLSAELSCPNPHFNATVHYSYQKGLISVLSSNCHCHISTCWQDHWQLLGFGLVLEFELVCLKQFGIIITPIKVDLVMCNKVTYLFCRLFKGIVIKVT